MASESIFNFSPNDLQGLANMLDPNAKHERNRPGGQTTGFSASDAIDSSQEPSADDSSKPSGIAIPHCAVDIQIGLPLPSNTREGRDKIETEVASKLTGGRALIPPPIAEDIWSWDEVTEEAQYITSNKVAPLPMQATGDIGKDTIARRAAGRVVPVYDVLYKESIGTQDIYLGMDFERDGSSAACEGVVVAVKLPEVARASDIDITVEAYSITIETAVHYYARIALPIRVEEGIAKAKWIAESRVLHVTLTADTEAAKVKVM
eukprot:Tbor_TRINITY_DN1955_c0_g1::TRINITY_DN1955_c0_g1_i1::g.3497::m.3497